MGDTLLRLRLHIQRNGVPDARIVFLAATTENTTVAQLLEQVNDIVPLESPDWGLDDYVVEIPLSSASPSKRFECLHYQIANKLFDRDEEVFIRPLSSADLKKLRIGGRHQISVDGKHLVDGLPFGRPLLKRPHGRPAVTLAPRKPPRPLLEFQGEGELQEDDDSDHSMNYVPYSTESDGDVEDEEEDSSEDYEDAGDDVDEDMKIDASELQALQDDARTFSNIDHRRPARVRFAVSGGAAPKFSNLLSSKDTNRIDPHRPLNKDTSRDTTAAGKRDGENENESSEEERPHELSSKKPTESLVLASQPVAPNQGKARTKKRNARRRAKRAMDKSREEATNVVSSLSPSTQTSAQADAPDISQSSLGRRLRLDMGAGRRFIASALGLRSFAKPLVADDANRPAVEFDGQKIASQPMAETATGTSTAPPPGHPDHWASNIDYSAVECCDANFELDKPSFPFVQQWHTIRGQNNRRQQNQEPGQIGSKRKQNTVAATDVPMPKKRAVPSTSSESSLGSSSDSDSAAGDDNDFGNNHKTRSKKPAHDCKEDSVSLHANESDSTSDSEFSPGDDEDSASSSDGSSTASDLEDESEVAVAASHADLPPLPMDITSLPALNPGQASEGMLLTWKDWILSEQTNWQPQVVDVTAHVLNVKDDGRTLEVVMAHRDRLLNRRPAKQYDEETGQRLYGRFEGPDVDDDETEDADGSGSRTVVLADLLEPRILQKNFSA
ncbi:hypothetical protein SEPCBS119000_006090 [Sporothrix epigloea]|uniref:DUF7357 domain-containing protein n=1 Tax=Sporothrix epigloea TaxID=1892477 RepID=A0ABP0E5A7_9PEZI